MAFGRSLFAVGSSVALVLLFAGPAAANNFSASVTGARANYTDSGDVLTATDTATDGQSARAQVRRNGTIIGSVTASGGSGTSNSINLNIPENVAIQIRACRMNGGAVVACSGWISGTS